MKRLSPYHFFLKHAGYSYDPKTETPAQGRINTAKRLAMAERYAQDHDWSYTWEPDNDGYHSYLEAGQTVETCEFCVLTDDSGDVLASLGCIDDADDNYRRVVEAELALEAYQQ